MRASLCSTYVPFYSVGSDPCTRPPRTTPRSQILRRSNRFAWGWGVHCFYIRRKGDTCMEEGEADALFD